MRKNEKNIIIQWDTKKCLNNRKLWEKFMSKYYMLVKQTESI